MLSSGRYGTASSSCCGDWAVRPLRCGRTWRPWIATRASNSRNPARWIPAHQCHTAPARVQSEHALRRAPDAIVPGLGPAGQQSRHRRRGAVPRPPACGGADAGYGRRNGRLSWRRHQRKRDSRPFLSRGASPRPGRALNRGVLQGRQLWRLHAPLCCGRREFAAHRPPHAVPVVRTGRTVGSRLNEAEYAVQTSHRLSVGMRA